jgi:predicted nucleic acid-binding protein
VGAPWRKIVLDTNCFVDASRSPTDAAAFAGFCAVEAPRLYLSAVVAAELRAGATTAAQRRVLEQDVLAPYLRRDRVVNPSPTAWKTLGTTLAHLVEHEGLVLRETRRSFIFDILIAWSCRESGAILVSRDVKDLSRITKVFAFDFVSPYPSLGR